MLAPLDIFVSQWTHASGDVMPATSIPAQLYRAVMYSTTSPRLRAPLCSCYAASPLMTKSYAISDNVTHRLTACSLPTSRRLPHLPSLPSLPLAGWISRCPFPPCRALCCEAVTLQLWIARTESATYCLHTRVELGIPCWFPPRGNLGKSAPPP